MSLNTLPADLPENWSAGQTVSPNGVEVGLSRQHGYNYLAQQVNATQLYANALQAEITATVSTQLAALQTQMQALNAQVTDNTARIALLWDAVMEDITGNPFTVLFNNLESIELSSGVWNQALQRLEC